MMKKHTWTEKDDVMVFYVFKYGYDHIPYSSSNIAELIGVSKGSVSYRIGNFKAIEGVGKASNYGVLSKNVYEKYGKRSEIELRKIAFDSTDVIGTENILEGQINERKYLYRSRNRLIVEQRKKLDKNKCQACGFVLKINDYHLIDVHHKNPLSEDGVRITEISDLVCLCPTCHRIAHTRKPPYSEMEIKQFLKKT